MTAFDTYVEKLCSGDPVEFRPRGHSMQPRIESGQLVRLEPTTSIVVGDIVLARVKGKLWLHLVSAIDGDRVQISNNKGHVNGWTSRARVYGTCVSVDP